jgi:hypothetical protein
MSPPGKRKPALGSTGRLSYHKHTAAAAKRHDALFSSLSQASQAAQHHNPNPPLRPLPRQHDAEEEPQCNQPN